MGEGGEDVIGFVVLFSQRDDAHCVEGILKQGYLTDELRWCLPPGALVFRVNPGPKRITRNIKRHRHVGGLFLVQ